MYVFLLMKFVLGLYQEVYINKAFFLWILLYVNTISTFIQVCSMKTESKFKDSNLR